MSAYLTAMLESPKQEVIEELLRVKDRLAAAESRATAAEAECERLRATLSSFIDFATEVSAALSPPPEAAAAGEG